MTADSAQLPRPIVRVPTGLQGLDTIINGGLLLGGIYIIMGPPGVGKTILANQIGFHHVQTGGRVLYVTLLAETHSRMLMHLQSLEFYNPEPVGDTLYYISGYRELEEQGLRGLLDLLRRVIREQRATMIILDGLATAEDVAHSDLDFKRFLHELQAFVQVANCTALLLTQVKPSSDVYTEHTMVDGLIELSDTLIGLRAMREVMVRKFRGSSYLRGRHFFEITDAGITIHPRTESVLRLPPPDGDEQREKLQFGVPRFDEMLHGGILSSSTTMLIGAPGSGKTLLGLHFLSNGAEHGEQGLYFGFYETPPRLMMKANSIGLNFDKYVKDGLIDIVWQPPLENVLDVLAERLLSAVRLCKARRLFIDGIDAFKEASHYPDRLGPFFTALINELRAMNVTTMITVELQNLVGPPIDMPYATVTEVVENIIFLRYVELRSQLYRLISILKMRESTYDPSIREFLITANGIEVASTFESAESILTGAARPITSRAVSKSLRRQRSHSKHDRG